MFVRDYTFLAFTSLRAFYTKKATFNRFTSTCIDINLPLFGDFV